MNENEILEEEIAEIVGDEDTTDRVDDEFEYDENGDIIIPDVNEDGEENGEDADVTEEETETEEEEVAETPAEDEEEPTVDKDTEGEAKASESEELARLRALVESYKSQAEDTLAKLGVEADDPIAGLAKLAAEADGKSPEEYAKELAQKKRVEEAMKLLEKTEFEKVTSADLAELKTKYPELKECNTIFDLPNSKRFMELRAKGLSVKEAYSAANPDGIRNTVAKAVTKQNLNESKSHLKSSVPKGTKDTSLRMPKEELSSWREMFPKMSDKEIINLYRKTADKK